MQCTIYAPGELRKKRKTEQRRVAVLARFGGMLVLLRDEINALWTLPYGELCKGESAEETVRRVLGEALGEAVFDVELLCEYAVTGEDGREAGGCAYVADVREWPAQRGAPSRAFARLPLGSQTANAALVFALHRWAGEFFDERLALSRLGEPASF